MLRHALDAPRTWGATPTEAPTGITAAGAIRGAHSAAPEATVEDMIAFDLKFNEENGHPFGPQEEAERLLRAWLPTLKAVAEVGNGN